MATTGDLRVSNLFSLKDYVCLVTGGGTGIGLMATQALAANGDFLVSSFNMSTKFPPKVPRYTSQAGVRKSSRTRPNSIARMPKSPPARSSRSLPT